jgi:hypothetical protein
MAGNINGVGTSLGIGKEASWGTTNTGNEATKLLNFISESMKLAVERKEEESLLAATAAGAQDIMGHKVSGDFSVIAKPDELGYLFAWAFGSETVGATDDAYATGSRKHTFVPCSATDSLPSCTLHVDRKIAIKEYTGCKVSSLKLDAKSGDYLRATVSLKGKAEATGEFATGLSASQLKAFKFLNGTCSIDGAPNTNITGVSLSYDNKLDDGDITLGSGLYSTEPEHSLRDIQVTLDTFYDDTTEGIREDNYKVGATASIAFTFISPSEIASGKPYKFTVTIPNVDVTAADANIGGRDKVKVSLTGKALAIGSTSPITVEYWDIETDAYMTALT